MPEQLEMYQVQLFVTYYVEAESAELAIAEAKRLAMQSMEFKRVGIRHAQSDLDGLHSTVELN